MSARIITLSPQDKDIEEVMQMESFKHFTKEQAIELLRVVDAFCEIAYSLWSKQEQHNETQVIQLPIEVQKKAA